MITAVYQRKSEGRTVTVRVPTTVPGSQVLVEINGVGVPADSGLAEAVHGRYLGIACRRPHMRWWAREFL